MMREFTCIMCPNGCEIQVSWEGDRVGEIVGAACPKGREYAAQELTAPKRNIATSVLVEGGALPLASVRLTAPIPREAIFPALREIQNIVLKAPVKAGTVVIQRLLGYESDVVVTRDCDQA